MKILEIANLNKPKVEAEYLSYEANVLACIITEPSLYLTIREIITSPEYFQERKNKIIYEAIQSLYLDNKAPDLITVFNYLKERKTFTSTEEHPEPLMDHRYLGHLNDHAPTLGLSLQYAERIKDAYIRNNLAKKLQKILDQERDPANKTAELITQSFNELLELELLEANTSSFKESCEKFIAEIKSRQGKELVGITSGFSCLDRFTMGYPRHGFIVIGGDTGTGKSVFALNCAVWQALQGLNILYISLEMPDVDLLESIVPQLSESAAEVNYDDLFDSNLPETKLFKLEEKLTKMSGLPLHFAFNIRSATDILFTIDHYRKKHNIDCVYIDHGQLVDGATDYQSFANQTAQFKQYTIRNQVPIVCLSQFNSESNKRQNKEPHVGDLRGGKNIAQDADIIFLLYKLDRDSERTYLKIEKNRKGKTSKVVYFDIYYEVKNRRVNLSYRLNKPTLKEEEDRGREALDND